MIHNIVLTIVMVFLDILLFTASLPYTAIFETSSLDLICWLLHSLEYMRSSSALPYDHVVLGEYRLCLLSAFMLIGVVYT